LLRCASTWSASGGIFDLPTRRGRLEELGRFAEDPDLWKDPAKAQRVLKERTAVERSIQRYEQLATEIEEADLLLQMAIEEEDDTTGAEVRAQLPPLRERIREVDVERLLGREGDVASAIVEIHPGAGGLDAQDWADKLLRMVTMFGEKNGFKVRTMELLPADEGGIKSATLSVDGPYAYGQLKCESGVHRLVRISPFDASARRHTAFAAIDVYPDLDDDIEIEINENELRIDTYRASGAGGQHVNVTDSAVRITHVPTNIVVQCQNERSQHKNKSQALKVLRARLYDREIREREEKFAVQQAQKKRVEWGSQIRSYVLHPYRLVKDHRTGVNEGNVDRVLDGDLTPFIEAYLAVLAGEAEAAAADEELD
jgi:peptide chain release factor 2